MSNYEFTEYFKNHFDNDLKLFSNKNLLCRKTIYATFYDIQNGKVSYHNLSYFFLTLKFIDFIYNSFPVFKYEKFTNLLPNTPKRDGCVQGCHISEDFFTILRSAKDEAKTIGVYFNINENSIEIARTFFIRYLEQISNENPELNIDSIEINKTLSKEIVSQFIDSYN